MSLALFLCLHFASNPELCYERFHLEVLISVVGVFCLFVAFCFVVLVFVWLFWVLLGAVVVVFFCFYLFCICFCFYQEVVVPVQIFYKPLVVVFSDYPFLCETLVFSHEVLMKLMTCFICGNAPIVFK